MHSSVLFGWATLLLASSGALAHMEMTKPAPLRSKYNPSFLGSLIDYDMVRPLDPSAPGEYPCFGYHKDDNSPAVETYQAGGTYEMQIAGGASHNGGSCQLSLSYDNGQTFHVIKSMIGNCPLKSTYSFTIPSDVPSKKGALFAWTWFNRTGNREMYMNCARVDIDGRAAGQLSGPDIFRANIAGTQCATEPGKDPIFPNPGPDVEYGDESLKGQPPSLLPGCEQASAPAPAPPTEETQPEEPIVQLPTIKPPVISNSAPVLIAPPTSRPAATSSAAASSTPAATSSPVVQLPVIPTPAPIVPTPSSRPIDTAPPATMSTIKTPVPTHAAPGGCVSGAIVCSPDGSSWSVCNNGALVRMGAVAAGMTCTNGKMVLKASGSLGNCAADGETSCTGSNWAVCVNGTWVDMGALAAGSSCEAGKISQKRSVVAGAHARRHSRRRAHGVQKHF